MWEKIKAFFSNKVVKIVEWVILALVSIGLIVGGVTSADVSKSIVLVAGIVDAVALLVTFISSTVKGKQA